LLLRLKILASKDSVEKWIKKYQKKVQSTTSLLFYVFDNCNFRLNVSAVKSNYGSSFLNIINHFIVELSEAVEIPARELWQKVNREEFKEWISPSFDETLS
jgi:hypothetical protein